MSNDFKIICMMYLYVLFFMSTTLDYIQYLYRLCNMCASTERRRKKKYL